MRKILLNKSFRVNPRPPSFWQKIYRKIELIYEKLINIDFSIVVPSADLGLDESLVVHGAPCGGGMLTKVLKKLDINKTDRFLDIGCAKGSSINSATKFPFSSFTGIDISQHLIDIAKLNFIKLGKSVNLININAIDYKNYGDFNFFHLCNPFPESVCKLVFSEIYEQVKHKKERIFIIYNNPVCHVMLVNDFGFFLIGKEPDAYGNGIFIYSNKNIDSSY